ncbi:MAG TPA: DUF1566 domain-containing protein [Wenzhouxiangella sp.]|nr:DUF1566 domain-containing protein [Wenzhouxiangella sp.]
MKNRVASCAQVCSNTGIRALSHVLFLAALLAPFSVAAAEETCGSDPGTSPNHSDNYILGEADGEAAAMHWESGLVWKRCSQGQSWDGSGCGDEDGAEKKSWNGWMADFMPWRFADLDAWWSDLGSYKPPPMPASPPNRLLTGDWRMPYRLELLLLTQGCDENPTINRGVFPNASIRSFWSGSPDSIATNFARGVNFYSGGSFFSNRPHAFYARLVRGGQPFEFLADPPAQTAAPNAAVEFDAITLTASSDDNGSAAWGGARIEGEGGPEFEVNGNGDWVTEAIVASGDAIRVRMNSSDVGTERTATLVLRSGQTQSTLDDASNGGDEDTAMKETSAEFAVLAVAEELFNDRFEQGASDVATGDGRR